MTGAQIEEAANWRKIRALMAETMDTASRMPDGRRALSEALCGALEITSAGSPDTPFLGALRADAKWWADLASPAELEAYTGAALRRIERTTFARGARKRLLVMLWKSLTAEERKAFLAKVGGK